LLFVGLTFHSWQPDQVCHRISGVSFPPPQFFLVFGLCAVSNTKLRIAKAI
jgi:hypothetical protein